MKVFLRTAVALLALFLISLCAQAITPIRVLVWDERQPAQKKAYTNFLGNAIADYLNKQPGIKAKSVALDDPEQGLSKANLDNTDVLIWWGHVRHGDVKQEHVDDVVQRIKDGKLRLIALHSAHWSKVFIQAMKERAIQDAWKKVPADERASTKLETIPADLGGLAPKHGRMTPWSELKKSADGKNVLTVKLPSCVFPAVHDEGLTSHVTTTFPKHQIARGIPAQFDVPQTEVYAGPFHVPLPDAIIFREKWDTGESFPSGCVWTLGKGKIFYFRAGHEAYPIYTQPIPLKIVENAVRWLPF
jgi:trehalose utilization protein